MANSSSEDETDTLPERPTRIQPYQFEPEAKPHAVFHGVCEIALTEVLARYTKGRDAVQQESQLV